MTTARELRDVIATLEQFTDEAKYTLDMNDVGINKDPSGRVSTTLVGLYTLARCPGDWSEPQKDGNRWYCGPDGLEYSWAQGADEMSHDLGFPYSEYREDEDCTFLEQWARNNPELWGNEYGGNMFLGSRAYGVDSATVSDVLDHLRSVADRLAQREAVA